MFDVINQILHLPPEVAIFGLTIFAIGTYNDLRQDWKFQTLLVLLSTKKPNAKTKAYEYSMFVEYGLTKNLPLQ